MKTFFVILATAIVITATWLAVKNRIGDVRPALNQPKRSVVDLLENKQTGSNMQGEPVQFPLTLPQGFNISIFAKSTPGARDLEFTQAGTLLVSLPGNGKVVALPDRNHDGKADEAKEILTGKNKPHGIAFHNGKLFVAEETQVTRYNWDEQNLTATQDKVLFSMPAGGRHSTRTLVFDKDGNLYVSIGSTCDVCFEKHPFLTSIIISDADGKTPRVFSKGLRNAVFITADPAGQQIWGTEMGRDFLGDETPPDEINIFKDGADYGWPVCYGDKLYDKNFGQRDASYCEHTTAPIYKIPAHSAPLGLTFINSQQFPQDWQGDLLVVYHGSWNRSTPTGYKVVRMHVKGQSITGEEDFITGFLQGSNALGRPVDVIFDKNGNLFVSDDKAGVIYLVTKK